MSRQLPDPLGEAVGRIRAGGLLAYPTETVWGLAADARCDRAVERLRAWKGRTEEASISILVDGLDALDALGVEVGAAARELADRFWPGPLTLVLPGRGGFAPGVARADGAVGVRCSSHPLAAALARRLRAEEVGPVTATSLNRSGQEAARSREAAERLCVDASDGPILIGVDRAEAGGGGESTVLDLSGPEPTVLRWGLISEAELRPALDAASAR